MLAFNFLVAYSWQWLVCGLQQNYDLTFDKVVCWSQRVKGLVEASEI